MFDSFDQKGRRLDPVAAGRLLADLDARRVAFDIVVTADGPVSVSTVFLVVAHGADADGRPVLWETLVDGTGGQTRRYSSRADAEAGHARIVAEVAMTHDLPH